MPTSSSSVRVPSFLFAFSALEGLFAVRVVVVVARCVAAGRGRGGPGLTPASSSAAAVGAAALDLVDLRGREAQARGDVVRDDLDDRALLALVGLPAALLEPAA